MIRAFGDLTVNKVLDRRCPSITALRRDHGEDKVQKAVSIMLLDLSSSFDGELEDDQVEELYAEMSSTYLRNLSLEDIYVACRQIKTKETSKLTTSRVLKHITKYWDDRIKLSEQRNYNAHLSRSESSHRLTSAGQRSEAQQGLKAAKEYFQVKTIVDKAKSQLKTKAKK